MFNEMFEKWDWRGFWKLLDLILMNEESEVFIY